MSAPSAFPGTVATVRRSLERTFVEEDPRDAAWRGAVGTTRTSVRVDVVPDPGDPAQPLVLATAEVLPVPRFTGPLAQAVLLEHDGFVLGRMRHDGSALIAEQAVLGGHTLHQDEMTVAVWTAGWIAANEGARLQLRVGGMDPGEPREPEVDVRRGAEERVQVVRERVAHWLEPRGFVDDPVWGLHGPAGSTRVFVSVLHHLERSTAVVVAAPVVIDCDLTDEFALEACAIAQETVVGRFAYTPERRELWFEHAIVGDDLQEQELAHALDAVAATADGVDERLVGAHGGRRYLDRA
ncbi:MAG: T3SS (YopN, CesT) and YbjN peptide-binding chaperone 1 [Actinomycetota bacterium]